MTSCFAVVFIATKFAAAIILVQQAGVHLSTGLHTSGKEGVKQVFMFLLLRLSIRASLP